MASATRAVTPPLVYSYANLCEYMRQRTSVRLTGTASRVGLVTLEGVINGIRPEDGSGNKWLVTLQHGRLMTELFIRTA